MQRAAGFTLIEILVSVLVLALGTLGGVAMQLHAMRTRYESALLSTAVHTASSMAERIRANASQIGSSYLGLDYDASTDPKPAPPPAQCLSEQCDSAQLASFDLYELKQQVARSFPSGRVRICRDGHIWQGNKLRWDCNGGPASPIIIKVGWRGKNPDGTPRQIKGSDYSPGFALVIGAGLP